MCGFAGYIDARAATDQVRLQSFARRMAKVLHHRGPDDEGAWADEDAGIALAHRRLAILDLSPAGHQPMFSVSGRFVIIYNGEIYNCQQLRQRLQKEDPTLHFRGHSDTEVMLAAFEQWGIGTSLERFNGMFAFALWDRQNRVLHLARDRFGEKPLYYGWAGHNFLFASELKALRAHPVFDATINRDALSSYVHFNCIPAPYSIYQNIQKLPPANCLQYSAGNIKQERYWSLAACVGQGLSDPYRGSAQEACEELDWLLRDAVKLRMHADVPLGAFLSSGIDSSLVVALMQAQAGKAVRTFSIGFHESAYDEARDARKIAQHLGTEHTELYVTSDQAIRSVTRLPEIYDEPFADSSQIPTLLVSQLTRHHVAVSLSGDGGDEIFGGYNRYVWGGRLWRRFSRAPHPLKWALAAAIRTIGPEAWDTAFHHAAPFLPRGWRQRRPGYKLHKVATLLSSNSPSDMYERMASHWFCSEDVVMGAVAHPATDVMKDDWPPLETFEQQAMYLDTLSYLPDDILVKLDRATMAVSLEGRIPYLDHRIVAFAWSLPESIKIRPNEGKWILRQVLYRYVPRQLVQRPKVGFGVPLDDWLRGPMRDWAEDLLDPRRLRHDGFFNPNDVWQKWSDHLSGRGSWQYHLWDILMFQLWLDHQKSISAWQSQPLPAEA